MVLADFLDLSLKKLVTCIVRDGTLAGPDYRILSRMCTKFNAEIIAAGGISALKDLVVLKQIGACAK